MPELEVKVLKKTFGDRVLFENFTYKFPEKRLTIIKGSNGSGKTTFINCVLSPALLDSGKIILDGSDITHWTPLQIRKMIKTTYQHPDLFPRLSLAENLSVLTGRNFRFWQCRKKVVAQTVEIAKVMLEAFCLMYLVDEPVTHLSFGQKKILEIIAAICIKDHPTLILLDEPLAGVHRKYHSLIADLINERISQGYAFILIEHTPFVEDIFENVNLLQFPPAI